MSRFSKIPHPADPSVGGPSAARRLRLLCKVVSYLALAWPGLSHAEERAYSHAEIRTRFLSLRRKYPELKAVRIGSLARALAAWVSVGKEIPVWVTDSRRQCDKDLLLRRRDLDGAPSFAARACTQTQKDEQGHWVRSCRDEPVGRDWWTSDGNVNEVRIGGVWREESGSAFGDPVQSNGILSEVTVDAARFRGRPARISVAPTEKEFPSQGGGTHACSVYAPAVERPDTCPGCVGAHYQCCPKPDICNDPCPPAMDESTQEWIERLNDVEPWIVAAPDEPFAGIYRSEKACREDAARFTRLPETFGEK